MTAPTQLLRSKYRATEGGCVSCAGDLTTVEALPGVKEVDALASGIVLVTHDGTVSDDAVVEAAKKSGLPLAPAGPARPVRV
ncbi:hypothetical protein [Microbacterium lacticum]|uniref:hypothetical protein n=1 Tax=Microbacterium lacticum TaxID=33885 RepID=UPI002431B645|nr:hypothetical protein [Microbacterium lacticum]